MNLLCGLVCEKGYCIETFVVKCFAMLEDFLSYSGKNWRMFMIFMRNIALLWKIAENWECARFNNNVLLMWKLSIVEDCRKIKDSIIYNHSTK